MVVVVIGRRWWRRRDDERPTELFVASIVDVGLIGAWVAFLNAGDDESFRVDVVPVVVGVAVVPVAVLTFLRLRAQLLEVQVSRRSALQALSEVEQSRRRIVEAAVAERHRIQHDLHDGAQQGFAAVQLLLWDTQRAVSANPSPDLDAARRNLATAARQVAESIDGLRALVQGIYPAVLHDHGLLAALEEVAQQSTVPLVLDIPARRWANELEITAYFCVKEAVANALKHAQASRIDVAAADDDYGLALRIEDDGLGEALPPWDGGLRMLQDRVEAFGGRITDFRSTRGAGTLIAMLLPNPAATLDYLDEED
jgi:signal transduction histidine kinase